MRVLFSSPILEHPPAGGPQLRIENSIKALSRACELSIVSRAPEHAMGGPAATRFYRDVSRELRFAPSVAGLSRHRPLRLLQKARRKVLPPLPDARFLLDLVDRRGIELLWFGYGNISFPLIKQVKALRPALRVVCDTDSVASRFILRELPLERDGDRRRRIEAEGRAKEAEEREWVELCDVTTAVSEVDAAYYRTICRHPERVHVFSNVVDLSSYERHPPPVAGFKAPCVYLAGTFGHVHSPMDRAARWLLDDILPRVRAAIPEIHAYIVGRGTEATLSRVDDPRVTIVGKTPSVLPYLCHADVALVPLQHESGTRFKILEAGACGVPLVSTTLGAEGLPVEHGRHLLIADDADAFAAAIVRLIRDKPFAKTLADRCRDLVARGFSVEALVQEARTILRGLDAGTEPARCDA